MVERPIRVADFVEVDGIVGQVMNIGIRSTVVRSGANAIITVPNTTFIEKNLTNWTKSESVRQSVRIGVAYGTDIELLRRVCLTAVSEVKQVLSEPAAGLFMQDFGDSALLFDVYYFIAAASVPDRLEIASNVRFRLNELFAVHKIEVPFPQRQVRMLT